MSHANARTTVQARLLIVERAAAGWPQAHIAKAMGLSRKCVKTWLDRHAAESVAGLADRSSRPHRTPTRTSTEVEARVLQLRREHRRGPDWIAAESGVPARTVSRVLARHGVPRLAELDPLTGQRIRATRATVTRYERQRPRELTHMDVKKLGRIPDGGGWRARGPNTLDHRSRATNTRIGYDYVHSLVDDYSRLAYSEVLPDEKAQTCAAFFARALDYFASHGITCVERLMTDNAWSYRHGNGLREICAAAGVRHLFIKPHCPWQNGKVERLNRTLQTEWAYRHVFTSNADRAAALAPWIEHYNTRRRHSALGGLPPVSRLPT